MKARQAAQWTEKRYSAAVAFAASGVKAREGRRWIERGILKPEISGSEKTKLFFSVADVLALAFMARLVRLGLSPSEGNEIGEIIADKLGNQLGQVFALAGSGGPSEIFMHIGRNDAGGLVYVPTRGDQPLPRGFPIVRITIEVLPLASQVMRGLGLMIIAGNADDYRRAAESSQSDL